MKSLSSFVLVFLLVCSCHHNTDVEGLSQEQWPTLKGTLIHGKDNVGDKNQLLALADALQESGKGHQVQFLFEWLPWTKDTAKTLPPDTLRDSDFVLLAGPTALDALQNSAALAPKSPVIWTSHLLPSDFLQRKQFPHLVFLPEHALSPEQVLALSKHTKVILLNGVPHGVTAKGVAAGKAEYERKHPAIPVSKDNLAVVLPGDAPDDKGTMKFFTPVDARTLAKHIVRNEGPHHHFLVSNGPRTGSHDYKSKQKLEPSPHRTGKWDEVTAAFVQELHEQKVDRVSVYDFQFSDLPSAYLPILAALRLAGGKIHIGGDSTSMVSEASDFLGTVTVDVVPSMSKVHLDHAKALFDKGRADLMGKDGMIQRNMASGGESAQQPSQQAAEAIFALVHSGR